MTLKADKLAEAPSRLAHELLLNTLEKLAEDDSDPELAQRVQRERAKLNGTATPVFGADQFEALRQGGKPRSAWRRRSILIACAVASMLAYLAFTSPEGLVVRSDGSVSGFLNVLREKVQGQSFWQQQLAKAQASLEWELAAPERRAELDRKVDSYRQAREEMYQRHPSLRPSAAEEHAEALRDEADRIEAAELERWLEDRRARRISELEAIVTVMMKNRDPVAAH